MNLLPTILVDNKLFAKLRAERPFGYAVSEIRDMMIAVRDAALSKTNFSCKAYDYGLGIGPVSVLTGLFVTLSYTIEDGLLIFSEVSFLADPRGDNPDGGRATIELGRLFTTAHSSISYDNDDVLRSMVAFGSHTPRLMDLKEFLDIIDDLIDSDVSSTPANGSGDCKPNALSDHSVLRDASIVTYEVTLDKISKYVSCYKRWKLSLDNILIIFFYSTMLFLVCKNRRNDWQGIDSTFPHTDVEFLLKMLTDLDTAILSRSKSRDDIAFPMNESIIDSGNAICAPPRFIYEYRLYNNINLRLKEDEIYEFIKIELSLSISNIPLSYKLIRNKNSYASTQQEEYEISAHPSELIEILNSHIKEVTMSKTFSRTYLGTGINVSVPFLKVETEIRSKRADMDSARSERIGNTLKTASSTKQICLEAFPALPIIESKFNHEIERVH